MRQKAALSFDKLLNYLDAQRKYEEKDVEVCERRHDDTSSVISKTLSACYKRLIQKIMMGEFNE